MLVPVCSRRTIAAVIGGTVPRTRSARSATCWLAVTGGPAKKPPTVVSGHVGQRSVSRISRTCRLQATTRSAASTSRSCARSP